MNENQNRRNRETCRSTDNNIKEVGGKGNNTPYNPSIETPNIYREESSGACREEDNNSGRYGYVYITTNKINGKMYIGQHKWNKESIDESYKGSGKALCKAFKKYGKENFACEIIEWCNSFEELNEREIYWIAYYNASHSKDFYNISDGGNTPILSGENHPLFGKPRSPKERANISAGHADVSGKNNPMYGRNHTDEVKEFIGNLNRGRVHSEEDKAKMREAHPDTSGENNSMYGKRGIDSHRYGKDPMEGKSEEEIEKLNKERSETIKCKASFIKGGVPVLCVETGRVYRNAVKAVEILGKGTVQGIRRSARLYEKGREQRSYGYHWRYILDEDIRDKFI